MIEAPPVFGALFCAERMAIWIKQIGIVGPIFTIRALFPVD